jgi:hypothetical protein
MTSGKKKILLLAGGVAAGMILAELALQLYSILAPPRLDLLARARARISLKDPRLGLRPNPAFWDHDTEGYRNASIPREAFVVAMGDSHTYGTGVWREQNWPHRLQELVGHRVYGISCGGWGPVQNLLELDRALSLKPRLIVQALYTGNDLYDCFQMVYHFHQLPELATTDSESAQAIRAAESAEPLRQRYDRLYELVRGIHPEPEPANPAGAPAPRSPGFRGFLRGHSKLYQLASLTQQLVTRKLQPRGWEAEKREAQTGLGKEYDRIFEAGGARTIFTPVFRSTAMDLNDPRIAEGFRIALETLLRINGRVREARTEFLVVLLPTKELVFRDLAVKARFDARDYWWVVEKEEVLRSQTMDFLRSHGIPFVDALPALRESLAGGVQPHQESSDGHPNPAGHRIIAGVVAAEMERRGLAVELRGQ